MVFDEATDKTDRMLVDTVADVDRTSFMDSNTTSFYRCVPATDGCHVLAPN